MQHYLRPVLTLTTLINPLPELRSVSLWSSVVFSSSECLSGAATCIFDDPHAPASDGASVVVRRPLRLSLTLPASSPQFQPGCPFYFGFRQRSPVKSLVCTIFFFAGFVSFWRRFFCLGRRRSFRRLQLRSPWRAPRICPTAATRTPSQPASISDFPSASFSRNLSQPVSQDPMVMEANQSRQLTQLEMSSDSVDSLLEAARYDDIDDIRSLASTGISLDSKDSMGRTALHMAAANGHLDIVEYLISQGVDLNALNAEKNTPLHWACLNGRIEVVKKLILAGASLSILNCYERTPVDEAVSGGKLDVIDAINATVAQLELSGVEVS